MGKLLPRPHFYEMSNVDVQNYIVQYIKERVPANGALFRKLPPSVQEEALQEMYIDLWNNRFNYNCELGAFSTYAFNRGRAVLKKITSNYNRINKINDRIKNLVVSKAKYQEQNALEISEDVDQILLCLSEQEREIVKLRFINDTSVKEIAKTMNFSEQKVYYIIRRIKDVAKNLHQDG
jgi:RNA polymerase sigma factor (sigma-70 family)